MKLGAFSISLAVQDLAASRAFYGKLGFEPVGGDGEHWQILRNEDEVTIGLFQGMFDRNILTFNPGWSRTAEDLDAFTDVREIQKELEASGLELVRRVEDGTEGPGSVTLVDPDGNPVLLDQHR
ncbi:MAG: VOC family protein [Planctomycetota bacterium JB042]